MRKSALRAQQITLGAAVFDKHGRILVDPDGFVPSAAVTESFLEKVRSDSNQRHYSWPNSHCDRMPKNGLATTTHCSIGCSRHPGIGVGFQAFWLA